MSPPRLERFDCALHFLKFIFSCLLSLEGLCFLSETSDGVGVPLRGMVRPAPFPLIELLLHLAHEQIEFVKGDVGEDWRDNRPLWNPAVGLVKGPFLQVASGEH